MLIYFHFLFIFKLLVATTAILEYAQISSNLSLFKDARRWAGQAGTRVVQGLASNKSSVSNLQHFGHLIDVYIADVRKVGKPPRGEPRAPH